jgi:hypothetical protein
MRKALGGKANEPRYIAWDSGGDGIRDYSGDRPND